ncbi:HAMP domain-containing sensor histidine kinase [Pelagicoccus enzymogenes]|uniref:HAMP domain-containing sensor histidine kinase n=1 Tax=Pelagicoccus enzymogenes TaxID=2773457 RepID=UPI00280E8678|nr:HAMP domain-containing sensor histidine kinase [Pelagicoccus enzymogenes]MDQ8196843.1 HAMP domain-containing sensor histidine kinase [Pelagicoccus enzymogenes]
MSQTSTLSVTRKALVSAAAGLLVLLFLPTSQVLVSDQISITLIWSMIFPMIIAAAWGPRWGALSGLCGGVFYPFLAWPQNGWAALLPSGIYLIFLVTIGMASQRPSLQKHRFGQIIALALSFLVYLSLMWPLYTHLFNPLLGLNAQHWKAPADTFFEPSLIALLCFKNAISVGTLCLMADLCLRIRSIRKFLALPALAGSRSNGLIFLSSIAATLTIWSLFITLDKRFDLWEEPNGTSYQILAFWILLVSGCGSARIICSVLERRYASESDLERSRRALQESSKKLQSLNRTLTETNHRLEKEKKRAEAAERLKSIFLMNLHHELRTPLNAINGFAQLLKTENARGADAKQYVDKIERGTNRFLTMIDRITQIAQIHAGETEVKVAQVDVEALLQRVKTLPSAKIQSGGVELHLPPDWTGKSLVTDCSKLEIVLDRLLESAGDAAEGKPVRLIPSWQDENRLTITIEYSGTLIDKATPSSYQTSSVEIGGLDIGLAIAQTYVQILGGQIDNVASPDKGSRIVVTIPNQEALPQSPSF